MIDLPNKFICQGLLASVGRIEVINGYDTSTFLVRHIRGNRVNDYLFKTNGEVRESLKRIHLNENVIIEFQIATNYWENEKENKSGYAVKLRALHIQKGNGSLGKGWYWKIQDYMDTRTVAQLKKQYPKTLYVDKQDEYSLEGTRTLEFVKRSTPPKPKETIIEDKEDEPF